MPAYLIVTIEVHNDDAYQAYREQVPALVGKHGGRFIVRAGASDIVEGTWPSGRIVMLEFPDYAAAQALIADPDYQPVAAIRHDNTTDSRSSKCSARRPLRARSTSPDRATFDPSKCWDEAGINRTIPSAPLRITCTDTRVARPD